MLAQRPAFRPAAAAPAFGATASAASTSDAPPSAAPGSSVPAAPASAAPGSGRPLSDVSDYAAPGSVVQTPAAMASGIAVDDVTLDTIERRLARHVGPIARHLVRDAARRTSSIEALLRLSLATSKSLPSVSGLSPRAGMTRCIAPAVRPLTRPFRVRKLSAAQSPAAATSPRLRSNGRSVR